MKPMKSYRQEATILAIGIIILGFKLNSAITTFTDNTRTVVVKGLSEREVKADKVIWSLKYKELGNDPNEMYNNFKQKNKEIVKFLTDAGVKAEEISINPPQISDRQADMYGNERVLYRYKANSVIIVTSSEVEKIRGLIQRQTDLMKLGIPIVSEEYGNGQARYEFTGLNDIKPDMIAEATRNARTAANQFAKDSDSRLGGIKRAVQGQFSIEDRDENTPFIKRIRVITNIEYYLKN